MLSICFNQLLVHLKHEHDDTSTGGAGSQDHRPRETRTLQEYKAATKPRTITKTMDDASHNLCEARFFPFPLDLKSLGMNMPCSISPVNTIVDLSHLGVDVNNPELARKMHNRSVTNIRLRDFSDTNLRNYHAAGDALVAVETSRSQLQLGRALKQLEGPKECLRAFFNFSAIARHFHTLDWSSSALFKVALEKYCGGSPTVSQFSLLFEKFIHSNGVRAQRQAVPMTYQEILVLWNTHIHPPTLDSATVSSAVQNELKRMNILPPKRGGARPEGVTPAKTQRTDREQHTFCENFNKSSSCSNSKSQDGCLDQDGKFMKHSCSMRMKGGKICGSSKHGFPSH